MITVEKIADHTFRVVVEGATTTTHTVTLSQQYHERLGGDRVSAHRLIQKSFEFLLERESNTTILSHFDLSEIGRYFPEYETTIKHVVSSQ